MCRLHSMYFRVNFFFHEMCLLIVFWVRVLSCVNFYFLHVCCVLYGLVVISFFRTLIVYNPLSIYVSQAKTHFVRHLSVRQCVSVCVVVILSWWSRIAMFRRQHMHSWECCHSGYFHSVYCICALANFIFWRCIVYGLLFASIFLSFSLMRCFVYGLLSVVFFFLISERLLYTVSYNFHFSWRVLCTVSC